MMYLLIAVGAAALSSVITWLVAQSRRRGLEALHETLGRERDALKTELEKAQESAVEAARELARLEATLAGKDERLQAQQQFIENTRADLEREFRLIASTILDNNSRQLGLQHEDKLKEMLGPFREQIKHFQEEVGKHFSDEGKEKASLQKEIEMLHRSSQTLSQQAEGLTAALRGNTQQQGQWGEDILERILEFCGFQEGIHYRRQVSSQSQDGKAYRPDFILNLTGGRNLVLDSKVSLNAYWDMSNAPDAEAKAAFLPAIVTALKRHVDDLHKRPYDQVSGTPDYVLMFVPVEGAYISALQHDPGLWQYGYDRRVLIISATNLLPFLKMVASLWEREKRYDHADEIARQAGALYDKLAGFVENLIKVGNALTTAQKAYEQSFGQLKTGQGNLIMRAEQLRALHISNKKTLPADLVERAHFSGLQLGAESSSDTSSDA